MGKISLPPAPSFLIAMRFRDSNRRPFLLKINPPKAKGAPARDAKAAKNPFCFFFFSITPALRYVAIHTGGPLFFAGLRPARAATRRLNCNLENQEKLWDTTCVLRAILKVLTKKIKPWHKLCLNGDFEKI